MKKYWQSLEQMQPDVKTNGSGEVPGFPDHHEELRSENLQNSAPSRRDFLKWCGFSITSFAVISGCEKPINEAIPFLIKPVDITPGLANHYASSYFDGSEYCSVLVKTRDGRPIKIEGNELSGLTKGGTSAKVQASVLSLYDSERLTHPISHNHTATWDEVDNEVKANLSAIAKRGGKIVILSSSIISPSTQSVIKDFIGKYPTAELIKYDAISFSATLDANKKSFGLQVIPGYSFDKAEMIVSFGADFLGTWLSPVEFTKQYVVNRKLDNGRQSMSKHIQFETGMSLTGSNADERIPIKPSEEKIILGNLYNELAKLAGADAIKVHTSSHNVTKLAEELWSHRKKSLVISGTNDTVTQTIINAINVLLESYGNTMDLNTPINLRQAIDQEMISLVENMNNGKVEALLLYNVNPVYDYPDATKFINGLSKVLFTLSFSDRLDESSSLVKYVCPDNHYLESWNDAEPKNGFFSLTQPTLHTLFATRSAQDSILKWAEIDISHYNYIKEYWKKNIFPLQTSITDFEHFWVKSLQEGVFESHSAPVSQPAYISQGFKDASLELEKPVESAEGIELEVYENIGIGNGKHANNPWLQELPDPISKVSWDNYVAVSPKFASEQGLENGTVVKIGNKNKQLELPVFVQPGQAQGTISIALGYGRTAGGKVAAGLGANAYSLLEVKQGNIQYKIKGIKIDKTDKHHSLALSQTHNLMEGRAIVKETTLASYIENPSSGNEDRKKIMEESVTLYDKLEHKGLRWGMSIDLNACTGCGNCVIACQAENNVPVVGKEEVERRRIMHWLSINRYFSDSPDNPQTVHQPMLCQHCENAPCENVCPVSATMHSSEGLNQMAYNRCVGTRYCMNNCPYKVRRFNWFEYVDNDNFDYHLNNKLGKMVLNPDVTVRSRGVVEKCSFCIQRIQEGKLKAKLENRELKDYEIQTACMSSCPANAIVFGNLNDKDSAVSQLIKDDRNYNVLEELHILPSIGYLTKVRNTEGKEV